jgi:ribonucleoside-triphosphate reductase (formate)
MVEGKTFSKIKKRDGRVVKFKAEKVTQAIQKAGEASGEFDEKVAKKLTLRVLTVAHHSVESKTPTVEEIQDIVEEVLLNSSYAKTAKLYIIYRDQHDKIRQIADTSNVTLVDEYLSQLDWQVNENSNMSYSLQGMNNYVAEEVTKVYWLNKIYPENIRDAYLSGDFHIHDLGFLGAYCVGWDLEDLLMVGFKGIAGKIESSPAKHFRTILGHIVNFFYTTQGETAGAQAFSSFDTLLAPFIKYDKLDYKKVKQAMQEFIFNMNVPTRVGFQTPFTNLTMDLSAPKHMKKKSVIIGGKPQKEKYGDFQKEMDMINKAFLEVMEEGDAKGRVFTFPIPTYNITKEFNWKDKNLDKLWEITAKYGIPNFSNYVNSDMSPDDARSMCCRLRLDNRELRKRGGGLFGSNPMTGSIGVVTMNLPRMGYLSKNEKEFFKNLKENMDLAQESLEIKRKVIEKFTSGGLYPYSRFYLRSVHERFKEYWKNHFSTIGLLGMNEACLNLLGEDITTPTGNEFAKKVLVFMRDTITEYQKETGNMYNLEATPAEGTSYRLALKDQKKFPDILFANPDRVKQKNAAPFYTNSSQLPVNFTNDVFEELELQDDIQSQYTGGTNLHFFVGEKIRSPKIVKDLVKKICHNYKLSYFTITPTFSICPEHGYIAGEHFKCPKCKGNADVYSRTVGYIRPVQYWNKGKVEEFGMRKTFKVNSGCSDCK